MKYLLAPLGVLISVGIGALVYQNSLVAVQPKPKPTESRPPAVETTVVVERPVQDRIQLVGTLEPQAHVQIRARTAGYITELPFDVGDFVDPAGSSEPVRLVQLDDQTPREAVRYAEAALNVAKARLAACQSRLELISKLVKRQETLAYSGAVTAQAQEERLAELAIADAEVQLQEAVVAQAQSDLQKALLALDETRILAPQSGFVAQRLVEVGDLAHPDDVLMSLVDLNRVKTVVHVVERDYPRVEVGQRAVVRVDAFPGEEFVGKVVRKAPVLNLETRTGAVQIEVNNPKFRLKPGMHARVSIAFADERMATVVPVSALVEDGRKPAVFVVTGEPPVAQLQPVELGVVTRDWVEIVQGVKDGDKVITLGGHTIASGQPVAPVDTGIVETRPSRTTLQDSMTGG